MISRLQQWRGSQPVRLFVYPAVVLIAVGLVTYGAINSDLANVLLGLAALLLGVPAAEAARSAVIAPATLRDIVSEPARAVDDPANAEALADVVRQAASVVDMILRPGARGDSAGG